MVAAVSSTSNSSAVAPPREVACLHCRLPIPTDSSSAFCCRGCEAVHQLLTDAGLSRYYELGGGDGHPINLATTDRKWLEPIAEKLKEQTGLSRIVLDVQGVHCAACVWLFDSIFERAKDGAGILVNPAVGSVELTVGPDFPIASYVADIEAFGYRFGPALKGETARPASSDLVWRMGVCIAIAMNTMIFGFSVYCGLAEGRVYRLFHALDFVLDVYKRQAQACPRTFRELPRQETQPLSVTSGPVSEKRTRRRTNDREG